MGSPLTMSFGQCVNLLNLLGLCQGMDKLSVTRSPTRSDDEIVPNDH